MNKLKNLALMTALDMARIANGLDVPLYKPTRIDTKTYGTNPKRCKSCADFSHCKTFLNKSPMGVACKEYKHKKK